MLQEEHFDRQRNQPLPEQQPGSNREEDVRMRLQFSIAFLALNAWPLVVAWTSLGGNPQGGNEINLAVSKSDGSSSSGLSASTNEDVLNRRNLIASFASASFAIASIPIPTLAADRPQDFSSVGTQAPPPDGSSPFVTLENGVKVKDFKMGTGKESIGPNSQVSMQISARLLNLNGVIFYNTKSNNPDGFGALPLVVNLGNGTCLPGLETGLVGMKKGGIRRIIVPEDLAYNKFPDLEPRPTNLNDQRALDAVVKNPRRDGSILFDVSVERFK